MDCFASLAMTIAFTRKKLALAKGERTQHVVSLDAVAVARAPAAGLAEARRKIGQRSGVFFRNGMSIGIDLRRPQAEARRAFGERDRAGDSVEHRGADR